VLITEVIYLQFSGQEQTGLIGRFIDYRLEIYIVVLLTIFSISSFKNEVTASNALTSEFPVEGSPTPIGTDFAQGVFMLDSASSEVPIDVTTTITNNGILVTEDRNKQRETTAFLLPWQRVKRCSIRKPKNFEEGLSDTEMQSRFDELRAILHMSRGNFPPVKIEIPWKFDFNHQIPVGLEIKIDWY